MKTKIVEVVVNGIKNCNIYITGLVCKNEKVKILVDNIETEYDNLNYTGVNVVFKNYVNSPEFRYSVIVPQNAKKLDIIAQNNKEEKIIYTKNITIRYRILNELNRIFNNIKLLFVSIIKSTKRVFLAYIWDKKHKTSSKKINKYYRLLRYNIGRRTIEKKYYIFEKQNDYLKWLDENENEENKIIDFKYNPLISILIPVYNTDPVYLKEAIESALNQVYNKIEICIVNDASTRVDTLNVLKEYTKKDKRIKIYNCKKNGNISKATNLALSLAKGDFVGLLDDDDILNKEAVYEVVKLLNENKNYDLIYTDEDKIALNGERCDPFFKPDYSPDTLLSINYICHFTTIRRELMEKVGGFRSKYDGAQDHDLFLRVIDASNGQIGHISKILYHWRKSKTSTALNSKNKTYTIQAGRQAIEDTLKRRKINGIVKVNKALASYEIEYDVTEEPKISIIIPTNNKADVLDRCLMSIYEKTNYKNFEIIVIDNNSDEDSLFKLLEKYKEKYENFYSYRYECEFNYSYLNNEGVKKSTGDYVVLLNNDTQVISSDWLKIMVGYAMQKHIGCVGIKLLYPSNNVQHAGVITGMVGVASHIYVNAPDFIGGYYNRLLIPYNVKMVTAACLMVKKDIYNEVSGFDENLKVAYNDVDFNVRIRNKGYYNILLPQIKMYHYESLSRGSDLLPASKERFKTEIKYIVDKLGQNLLRDEFYNDNLSKNYWFVLDKKDKHE